MEWKKNQWIKLFDMLEEKEEDGVFFSSWIFLSQKMLFKII